MPWPMHRCPPNGPYAQEHLDYIRMKAQAELVGPLLARIIAAVDACELNACALTGTPPALDVHCQKVLWARVLACQSNWGLCADELEHGI